jgi:hypothetical protein
MEFSRAIAIACFTAGKWLMVATGTLFLILAGVQHWRGEANADPALTIGTGISCLFVAALLLYMVKRMERMKKE